MIRKIAMLLVLPVMVFGLAACGEQEPDYVAVCVDPQTQERLPDDYCEQGDDDYLAYAVLWYMLANSSHKYPAVGHKVTKSHFKTSLPKGYTYKTGLSSKGGTSVKSYVNKTYSNKSSFSGSSSKSGGFGSSSSRSGGFSSGRR